MTAVLHYAFLYKDMGLSILPLQGKKPLLPWKHLIDRHPTCDEIKEWFADGKYDVGIICGRISGVVALDADSRDIASMIDAQLPRTEMMTATGKGVHFYYQIKEGQRILPRVKIGGMLLDVRGEVSYCVAAPSIHRATGKRYRQVGSWNLKDVPYFDERWIAETEEIPRMSAGRTGKRIRNGKAYISQIRAVSGQGGHNATFRAACALRDAGMSTDEALAALIDWNQTNAQPPWEFPELQHKIRSAFEAAQVK